MNKINIRLVGNPDFYKCIRSNNKIIDMNYLFWKDLFSPKTILWYLSDREVNNFDKNKWLLFEKNIPVIYKIFLSIRNNTVSADTILKSYYIVEEYLKFLERLFPGVIIKFFSYFIYKDIESKNLVTCFYEKYKDCFNCIHEHDVLYIELENIEQIYQLEMIHNYIYSTQWFYPQFSISLKKIAIFENKSEVKKILRDKDIFNIVNIEDNQEYLEMKFLKIFWELYYRRFLFNWSCLWRKCVFCNIWKYRSYKIYDDEKWKKIEELISIIKENNVKYISLVDPYLKVDDLILLAEKIIESGVQIKIRVLVRFSLELSEPKVLEVLSKAWFRSLCIWLESASNRLNRLMKKYDQDYSEKDFEFLVSSSSKYGINIHYYTIFGFPTETQQEIDQTKNFLLKNLKNDSFFTYTPWKFWINKGTDVYENPEKYNLTFHKNWTNQTFIDDVSEENININKEYRNDVVQKLFHSLFHKEWVWRNIDYYNFWNFIEESAIFHVQKMEYQENPYIHK